MYMSPELSSFISIEIYDYLMTDHHHENNVKMFFHVIVKLLNMIQLYKNLEIHRRIPT